MLVFSIQLTINLSGAFQRDLFNLQYKSIIEMVMDLVNHYGLKYHILDLVNLNYFQCHI